MVSSSGNVTKTSLTAQAFANIYNLINSRSNIPDPADSSGNRKFVYTREPDVLAGNFEGYPFIVVRHPKIRFDDKSIELTKSDINWSFEISVRSSDNILQYPSQGSAFCEQITDDLVELFNSTSTDKTLRVYSMSNPSIDIDDFDSITIANEVIFFSELTLTHMRRLVIA